MTGVALLYGFLSMFVINGAARNKREKRPNPRVLEYVGYMLLGLSITTGVLLLGKALLSAFSPGV